MKEEEPWRFAWLGDPRQVRSRCLATLADAMDFYFRSPVFLAWMSYGLARAIEVQAVQAQGLLYLLPRGDTARHRR